MTTCTKMSCDEIKSIFHHFKRLSMKQITQFFLQGESPTLKTSVRELKPLSIFAKRYILDAGS